MNPTRHMSIMMVVMRAGRITQPKAAATRQRLVRLNGCWNGVNGTPTGKNVQSVSKRDAILMNAGCIHRAWNCARRKKAKTMMMRMMLKVTTMKMTTAHATSTWARNAASAQITFVMPTIASRMDAVMPEMTDGTRNAGKSTTCSATTRRTPTRNAGVRCRWCACDATRWNATWRSSGGTMSANQKSAVTRLDCSSSLMTQTCSFQLPTIMKLQRSWSSWTRPTPTSARRCCGGTMYCQRKSETGAFDTWGHRS
mmetsp:Transcript_1282/g.3116  ORF Transcript_1282/g.3116 Transcript_1282/m.3116 type:complete len:254 (-) Transcript_1282:552-1313(-)